VTPEEIRFRREKYAATRMTAWPMTEEESVGEDELEGRARARLAGAMKAIREGSHIPYTGKPHRPDYYKPKRKNPRIDPSADASDVTHAWGIDDPRIASAIERLLRAGKKPGEPLLKDLHKTMEEIHRAIEYAEMEGEG